MKRSNLIWIIPILGIVILIFALIEIIKMDTVKANNKTLKNPHKITKSESKSFTLIPQISNITFREVDSIYDRIKQMGYTTDLQRDEKRKQIEAQYLGRLVQWTGKVADVDRSIFGKELYVKFKHTERSIISNVTVYFPNSEKRKLLNLQEGDWVTYQGRIKLITAGILLNHKLVNGKIIRIQRKR